jgi:hypothetical protein
VALLSEEEPYTDDQLGAFLRNHRHGIEGLAGIVAAPPATVREPLSLLTASGLAEELLRLIELAEAPAAPRALRVAVINASYDGLLAIVDLVKSHTELSKVPRGPSAGA